MDTLDDLNEQLWAATAHQRTLQAQIAQHHADELQRRVDAMVHAVDHGASPHAVLEWVDNELWASDPAALQGALAKVLCSYFLAVHSGQVTS